MIFTPFEHLVNNRQQCQTQCRDSIFGSRRKFGVDFLFYKALYDYYDQTGPHSASYEISSCSMADDVAMVRIESKFGESEFSDMFSLVKDGTDWKIVSKVYHVK